MSFIIDTWEAQKQQYCERFCDYMKKWKEEGSITNSDTHGHAMECSYVLINIFGYSNTDIDQLERYGYLQEDIGKELSESVKNIIGLGDSDI